MFPEDLEEYKNCVPPTLENVKAGKQICPSLCDFKKCDLKCDATKLNEKYWDSKKNTYRKLNKDEINYNTFNDDLAKYEVVLIKNRIKDLYRFKHVYMYNEILDEIRKSFLQHQSELFEVYFLDQALEDMMPKSENDHNNYKDTVYDKYNRSGYLIQRGKYYIFQSFDSNEDIPMYYRSNYNLTNENLTPIKNYIEMNYGKVKDVVQKTDNIVAKKEYDFETVTSYYLNRPENYIVGIVSKNINKVDNINETNDVFKIRPALQKKGDKKRGTGIYSLTGAVCATSKDKPFLLNTIKKIKSKIDKNFINKLSTREDMCNSIMIMLLYLEKYATSKDDNKITYVMIPANHTLYPFPYNLEDRIKYNLQKVKDIVGENTFEHSIKKENNGTFNEFTNLRSYILEITNDKKIEKHKTEMEKLGFTLDKSKYIMNID
jgi:hypothetical protein